MSPSSRAAGSGLAAGRAPRAVDRSSGVRWVLGLVAGVVVVGPGLGPGSWLNVDLVVTPITPLPRGIWGLGPEFPRRVPFTVPLAWASVIVDSTWVAKVVVVVAIASAVAGAWSLANRWTADLPPIAGAGAGLLYGLSPFLLTRVGVGHLPLVVAMAVLPWALPDLLQPCRDDRKTFLWCAALGATGFLGGLPAMVVVGLAVVATPAVDRRWRRPFAGLVASQLPWLVPGLVVFAQGGAPAASSDFRTDGHGPGGVLRVLAGHGFWRTTSQVGRGEGWLVPLAGLIIVGLAWLGRGALPPAGRRAALVVAAVGLAVPLASALPLVRRVYAAVIDLPMLAVLREGQRLLPLYLMVVAPLAARGATELARHWPGWREGLVIAAPLALAVVLAAPGLWGVGGALDPVRLPAEWATIRSTVHAGGGTVLSLPFFEYATAAEADGRTVVDPMPVYLGGDVLSSSDPGLSEVSEERVDPREAGVARTVAAMRRGERVADRLAAAGIHWIVLRRDSDWLSYRTLASDPGLHRVVDGGSAQLYAVRPWRGVAVAAGGRPVRVHQPVAPLAVFGASARPHDPVVWARAGGWGWFRGLRGVATTSRGLARVPGGTGPVWYLPAILVLLGDLLTATIVVRSVKLGVRSQHLLVPADDTSVDGNHARWLDSQRFDTQCCFPLEE